MGPFLSPTPPAPPAPEGASPLLTPPGSPRQGAPTCPVSPWHPDTLPLAKEQGGGCPGQRARASQPGPSSCPPPPGRPVPWPTRTRGPLGAAWPAGLLWPMPGRWPRGGRRATLLGTLSPGGRAQPAFPEKSQFSAQPQFTSPTSGASCPRGVRPVPQGAPTAGAAPHPPGSLRARRRRPGCRAGQVAGSGWHCGHGMDVAPPRSGRRGAGGLCPLGSTALGSLVILGPRFSGKRGPHLWELVGNTARDLAWMTFLCVPPQRDPRTPSQGLSVPWVGTGAGDRVRACCSGSPQCARRSGLPATRGRPRTAGRAGVGGRPRQSRPGCLPAGRRDAATPTRASCWPCALSSFACSPDRAPKKHQAPAKRGSGGEDPPSLWARFTNPGVPLWGPWVLPVSGGMWRVRGLPGPQSLWG